VEIKIGIQFAQRELTLESNQTAEQVEKAFADAVVSNTSLLTLVDEKGRKVVVPADKIAYVELGAADSRRVGFGG
jgi:Cu/Ag efflux protein CusF